MGRKTRVAIIESERGWGQRIDEVKEFPSRKKAEEFVAKFNKQDGSPTADWYMVAKILEE